VSPAEAAADRYVLGEKDDALSTEDRAAFRGFTGDRKAQVTLFEMRSPWMLRDEYVAELEAWAARLGAVSSPNVARILGVHRPAGRLFIVYEALEGETLAQQLLRGPMDEMDVFSTMEGILSGLKGMHSAGVLHRGLRPDRILVDRQDTVKVIEPAPPKATRTAGEEETLREKGLKGEVRYMSPELCLGQEAPGPPCDIYSLGLIVCEMLLGEQNLQRIAGETVRFWLNWHVDLYKKAVTLAEIDASLSPELSELVSKMLEKRVKNRYGDAAQVLADLAAFRSGRKKVQRTARPGAEAAGGGRAGPGGGARSKSIAIPSPLLAAVQRAGLTSPRTIAMACGVGLMMFLCVAAAVYKMLEPDGSTAGTDTVPAADDPCKRVVEDALTAFRREDFDATSQRLAEIGKLKCATVSEQAANSLRRDVQRARTLSEAFKESMRRAKEAEGLSQTGTAIGHYQDAKKTFKEVSTLIQQPDRALPDALAQRLATLEPVRILEEAKAALKSGDADAAKSLSYRVLDNYPNSTAAHEADDFAKKVLEVMSKRKVYVESFDKGRELDAANRWLDAAQMFWQAKLAHEDVQRLGDSGQKAIPQDLRDRLDQVYPKIWAVKTPQPDQKIVADDLLVEVAVPEKFFRQITINRKTYPIKGDHMSLKIPEATEGSQIMEFTVTSVDNQKFSRKVVFRYNLPAEAVPSVQIRAISASGGVALAEIVYNNENYTVEQGWEAPDRVFRIVALGSRSITIMTAKKKKIVIPY
jgi:hypothetical protein